ncbi:MAG TPA: ATP-binding protein [Bacteroidota bacterium]|jgi:nitrogen fixation/metabolism regulation signal transduction histidine kinase|nr:ATP-binding protein [Bacteroidota bacterium]
MIYKSFRLNAVLRTLLLAASILLLFTLITQTRLYATTTFVALFIVYQIFSLIRFVERTNFELSRFLRSIRYADFSQSFSSTGRGRSFDELNAAFTEVVDEFQRARSEKEEHAQYLQMVVQHIGIGLIAFTSDGEIRLLNTAAKRLLQVNQLANIGSLAPLSKEFVDTLQTMKSGDRALVKVEVNGELLQLIVYAREMKLREQHLTLISVQNIRTELDEKEIEAWQKLIRVLTHEIMNSITPISSLASTVNEMLRPGAPDGEPQKILTMESVHDIRSAVETIEKRSQGLLHFVDAYRKLMRTPTPKFQIVRVADLFGQVEQLMRHHLVNGGVAFSMHVEPESLEVTADPELIEQVLINLLLNAVEATQNRNNAAIELSGRMGDHGRVILEVTDNGPGIPKEVQDRVFVPLFTTKPSGSGIGLSLSRQIMRLHRGMINVTSDPDKQTTFVLRF